MSATAIQDPARVFLGQLAEQHRRLASQYDEQRFELPLKQVDDAYKGGQIHRLWKDWMPAHRSGDSAIEQNWSLLTARMRDLMRNDGVMKSAKRALAKHVVGSGIATYADVMDGEESDDAFNFEADDWFEHWAEEEADVSGKLSWSEMQWQGFNDTMETGEILLLECFDADPNRTLPLCYQLLETEQLDCSLDRPAADGQNKIVRGVEYDNRGRPVQYRIFDAHPYDQYSGWTSQSTWVAASRVIHVYLPNRASENRGVTWFSANVQPARDLDWYLGNELTAAALGALLTLIVKRKNGTGRGIGIAGDGSDSTDSFGNLLTKWGRGTVADIGVDDEVKVAESNRPNRDAAPFIKLILQMQSMGIGCSYLRLTGDYSQSSYTSARGAHLDDQAFFVVLQSWLSRAMILPVRKRHTITAAGYGLFKSIGARQFQAKRRQMLRTIAQAPGREQLDPEKETQAAAFRIRAGFSTHQIECGLRGLNWRLVARQQRREKAFFETMGVQPDLTPLGQMTPSTDQPQPGNNPNN